ncbi:hypothetical protein BDA96_09G029700 [Sorghum bicolor]|uniref:Uncharacterized protein n=1 Tax=Sorghum bicolor TaxID=4558 RepID=A0A921Q7X3_SORBI|nr:hypothetical protein BDA96_09G029700 [Sorghum bicolor]
MSLIIIDLTYNSYTTSQFFLERQLHRFMCFDFDRQKPLNRLAETHTHKNTDKRSRFGGWNDLAFSDFLSSIYRQ